MEQTYVAVSGIEIDLSELDDEKQGFFENARKLYRRNASWFEFERVVFSYTSPVFQRSRSRAEVTRDPLYLALKDMWLRLGMKQGFIAKEASADERETTARPAGANSATRDGDVAPSAKSAVSGRRGR